jgi:hypothetical protein
LDSKKVRKEKGVTIRWKEGKRKREKEGDV